MTSIKEIYKCNVCGNVIDVISAGAGELVCCGQPMELLKEKAEDEGQEKHVPVIEKTDSGVNVKVGSVEHPMDDNHYIAWIELIVDGKSYQKFLKPGDKPEAMFEVKSDNLEAREYCTIHGLWKGAI